MTKWSDIQNPFLKESKSEANVETASSTDTGSFTMEESNMMEKCAIRTTDGRIVPIMVDNGTRSVYPIRA